MQTIINHTHRYNFPLPASSFILKECVPWQWEAEKLQTILHSSRIDVKMNCNSGMDGERGSGSGSGNGWLGGGEKVEAWFVQYWLTGISIIRTSEEYGCHSYSIKTFSSFHVFLLLRHVRKIILNLTSEHVDMISSYRFFFLPLNFKRKKYKKENVDRADFRHF